MVTFEVTEPYLNPWLVDLPLVYKPGYGPEVRLRLTHTFRRDHTNPAYADDGESYEGGTVGEDTTCSWLSWVEYLDVGTSAYVMLPTGSWAIFTFSGGSAMSNVEYRQNLKLEKLSSGGSLTGFLLHYPSGKTVKYDLNFEENPLDSFTVYFMTKESDAAGNSTTFTYNAYNSLTTVTAADGVTFSLAYDSGGATPQLITNIVASYGATVSILHGETDMGDGTYTPDDIAITTIIDPVGIVSRIGYRFGNLPNRMVTPYGTTSFEYGFTGVNFGMFDRGVQITHPNSAVELYLLRNDISANDWPSFDGAVIPSGAPIGTLDTTERYSRNTYHWSIRQWSGMSLPTLTVDYHWADFKKGRIHHWLANTDPSYTHFDTLSWQQDPSTDGGTTEGQISWYDYPGKVSGHNEEIGTQIIPSVFAKVMPDGTTWYNYYTRNSLGKPTQEIEKWSSNGTAYYRTNTWSYSTDGIDLVEHSFGPSGGDRRITGYGYDVSHRPTSITNTLGEITTLTYDTSHRRIALTTPSSLVSSNTYGTDGFLLKAVDYHGSTIVRTNEYTWSNGLVLNHTDPRGLKTTNTWDYLRRLTQVKYPDGTTALYGYTNLSGVKLLDLTFRQDRLGYTNYTDYNCFRRPTNAYDALGRITAYGFCDCGALTSITNAYGVSNEVSSFTYDYQEHLLEHYLPDGTSRTNFYDLLGRVKIAGDALGYMTNYYDNLNRLIVVSNAFGLARGMGYDYEDRVTAGTNINGVVITFTYDNLGRLVTRTYPDGGVEVFGYTANVSATISYTNQLSKVTQWTYDNGGRKTLEVLVGLSTNTLAYSAANDLLTLSDGKSQTTTWGYDVYGNVASKMYANNVTNLIYSYDANTRLTNRWSQAMGNTAYSYDAVGNMTKIDYPTSADVTIGYDALNRSTSEVVAGLFTNSFTYFAGGAVASEDGPWPNDTISYTFNSAGNRRDLTIQQPTGSYTNGYTYDSAHRMATITSQAGMFTYAYYTANAGVTAATHLIQSLTLPQGAYVTNLFDYNGRETETKFYRSSAVLLDDHAYVYNAGNQRTKQTYKDAHYVTYTYDDASELRTAYTTNSSGVETTAQRYLYGYDAAWNMVKKTNNTTVSTYTVNNLNEATIFYSFDSNGNGSPSAYTYSYDDENRLISIVSGANFKSEFYYDARGRMRKRLEYLWGGVSWQSPAETRYVYDGILVIQERDGSNVPAVTYTRGTDLSGTLQGAGGIGGLLARSDSYQSGSGTFSNNDYYHADANGNVVYMIQTNQNLYASYLYDPFGNTILGSGAVNNYRFSSKELHAKSGLYHYGYRFYDSTTQRWFNRDPLGDRAFRIAFAHQRPFGGLNLYFSMRNNAISQVDAEGLTIYLCTKKTSGFPFFGFGRHAYLWDDRGETPNSERECGREGAYGSGGNNSGGVGPIDGGSIGDPDVSCQPVQDSQGSEDNVMDCCKNNANSGAFIPGLKDCHNAAADCLTSNGLKTPPHPRTNPDDVDRLPGMKFGAPF